MLQWNKVVYAGSDLFSSSVSKGELGIQNFQSNQLLLRNPLSSVFETSTASLEDHRSERRTFVWIPLPKCQIRFALDLENVHTNSSWNIRLWIAKHLLVLVLFFWLQTVSVYVSNAQKITKCQLLTFHICDQTKLFFSIPFSFLTFNI